MNNQSSPRANSIMTPIFELKKFQEEALRSGDITLEGIIKKVDSESPF